MSGTGAALRARPEELREVASLLRAAGTEVQGLADDVGSARAAGPAWVGLAALEQAARAEATARLVTALALPGERAGVILSEVADATALAREEMTRWQRQGEELAEELARLRVTTSTCDPSVLPVLTARIEQLQLELERARDQVRTAGEELELVLGVAARQLRDAVLPLRAVVEQVTTLGTAGRKLAAARRPARRAAVAVAGLTTLAQARWSRDGRVREAARTRLQGAPERWAQAGRPAPPGRFVPRRLHGPVALVGRLAPVWTWFGALSDLRDGGGQQGWRGTVTRVAAGGALVGIPAMALTVLPPVALAGAVAVGAYTVWTTGSWLYDHRRPIGRAARSAWSRARSAGTRAGGWVRRSGEAAVARARSRAGEGLRRLAQTGRRAGDGATRLGGAAGRWRSEVGRVVGRTGVVPDLPLRPGPRSPVLPLRWSW
ncbi:hypothetical protein ACPYOC_06630 [Ornithinimicrobium sp. W1665]|uniref:hypothetical protein n=1 Tax=Ornithinimicrobium sp. W1665 TaxID=3416666 RepID=UPI003CFAA779